LIYGSDEPEIIFGRSFLFHYKGTSETEDDLWGANSETGHMAGFFIAVEGKSFKKQSLQISRSDSHPLDSLFILTFNQFNLIINYPE